MAPPLTFALFLLGAWILMVFLVTNAAGAGQLRSGESWRSFDRAETRQYRTRGDSRDRRPETSESVTAVSDD